MGVEIGGGMIVGAYGDELEVPDNLELDFQEWIEGEGMDRFSLYYDADKDSCIYGYRVPNVRADEISGVWLEKVNNKAKAFKEATGVDATLFGSQSVW